MIIESANLSSLAPSSGAVESVTSLLIDGAGISEGFSGALMAQIGLLNNMKAGDFVVRYRLRTLRGLARCCRFAGKPS